MESIVLNLVPFGTKPVCHVSQCDVSRTILVYLRNGSEVYNIKSGDEIKFNMVKPDGTIVTVILSTTVGESSVEISTVEEMTDVVGRCKCELKITNGTKKIGTLNFFMIVEDIVGEVEPLPPPSPVVASPSLLAFYSKNSNSVGSLSHTFEEGGTFQFIVLLRVPDSPASKIDPTFTINDTETITPETDFSIAADFFYYGEIVVNAGDTIKVTQNGTYSNGALQLCILKDANMDNFSIVGFKGNNTGSFALPNNVWMLQVYKCGYYSGNNNYSYRLDYHSVKDNTGDEPSVMSIATPEQQRYWYGFTYAIIILGEVEEE